MKGKAMTNLRFAVLDPRSVSAALEANDKVFTGLVYGIEVTVPALAKRCTFNVDPQHSGGYGNHLAAIEVALEIILQNNKGRPCCGSFWDVPSCPNCDEYHRPEPLPKSGVTLATVRPDLDSVGTMAIFAINFRGENLESALERVAIVATADKFASGRYPGAKPLPSKDNPWPASTEQSLVAIAAAVADFKVPLEVRVATMEQWLLTGKEPEQYRVQVDKERTDLVIALEAGQIETDVKDGVAVVKTTHRAATMIGYCLAPVVVAMNPEFRIGGGEPHIKFTVCQYESGHVDLKGALIDLQNLEDGWGGSPTIIGSPQGVSSMLTLQQVVDVVTHCIRR